MIFAQLDKFAANFPGFAWVAEVLHGYCGDTERFRRAITKMSAEASGPFRHGLEGDQLIGLTLCTWICARDRLADIAPLLQKPCEQAPDAWSVAFMGVSCLGSIRRSLGLLEATRGRWKRAVSQLERALEAHSQPGATLPRLWTQLDLAQALTGRGFKKDRDRAARLLEEAHAGAIRLNLVELRNRIEREHAGVG